MAIVYTLCVVAAALLLVGFLRARAFERSVSVDVRHLLARAAHVDGARAPRPPLAEAWLARALDGEADRALASSFVRVEQSGAMRREMGGAWEEFRAQHVASTRSPEFVWHAKFRLYRVVDALCASEGRLEARLFGAIPLVRASGDSATRAQLQRYLAELAWAPMAIRANASLRFETLGDARLRVSAPAGGSAVAVDLSFDEAGDVVCAECVRDRLVEDRPVPTRWRGRFSDYRNVGPVRIPTRGEVEWVLDDGPFVYWRAEVTRFSLECGSWALEPPR